MKRIHFCSQNIAILVILFFTLSSCKEEQHSIPVRPVRAMEIQEVSYAGMRVFPGRTRALSRANLSFRVSGPLIERSGFVGDRMKKGNIVARIDPRDFEASLASAKGDLEKTEARLRFAESDYERAETVWKEDPGAISVSYLDQKREERNQLKGSLKAMQAKVKSDQDALSDTYLRAPFEGVIVATYVQNFEYVRAEQPILRLLDLTEVEMMIDVPESLIQQVPLTDSFIVRFDAIRGREFKATVKEIGTEASAATRTFPVTLIMHQPEDVTILAGMAGEAQLDPSSIPEKERKKIIVPPAAVFSDEKIEQSFVWILNQEKDSVKRREVEIGPLTSHGLIIEKGVALGDWIVTSGVNYLSEGQKVELLPVELNALGEQVEIQVPQEEEEKSGEEGDEEEEKKKVSYLPPVTV